MKTTTDFQLVDITKLIPYVNNARTHRLQSCVPLSVSSGLSILSSSTRSLTSSLGMAELLLQRKRATPKCRVYLWSI